MDKAWSHTKNLDLQLQRSKALSGESDNSGLIALVSHLGHGRPLGLRRTGALLQGGGAAAAAILFLQWEGKFKVREKKQYGVLFLLFNMHSVFRLFQFHFWSLICFFPSAEALNLFVGCVLAFWLGNTTQLE
ncbi:avirulence induced gene family protein [Striga asiatica]|uniref:Avirulence induced gene family protein n=1 Tax=Striga asiatica TaxID=4170 RepID=A0A5A7R1I1_STRAF|nr:avirulence induced gene family protein [Striga asiatica]